MLSFAEAIASRAKEQFPELAEAAVILQPEAGHGRKSTEQIKFKLVFLGECKGCGRVRPLVRGPSMTAYHFEGRIGSPEDPNREFYSCTDCRDEHIENMRERWDEYYSGLL